MKIKKLEQLKIKTVTATRRAGHGSRASKQQQQLNVDQYTLLKKPMEHLGKQLNVPGSFWQGRMSEDERDKIYKCTIIDLVTS